MARFKADEVDNYGGQGGGGFFSIQKDKEVKQVRFMYDSVNDVEGYAVHKVKIDGKDRYVNCLRSYNEPVDNCPMCRDKIPVQARLFIPVYNIDEDAVQVWDRGKTMFEKITGLCARYGTKESFVSHIFEVERHGKANDKKTTYEIFEVDSDDTQLSDLPELPEIVGGVVLDKTADDMEYFLAEGEFPPTDDDKDDPDEEPVRRRDAKPSRESSRDTGRRTPARSGRRNNDDVY